MTTAVKTIWYKVNFSEWFPRIEERLVVKETALMVEYEVSLYNWDTKTHSTSRRRARKISSDTEFFQSRENAMERLGKWLKDREAQHLEAAQKLSIAANNIKITPLLAPLSSPH